MKIAKFIGVALISLTSLSEAKAYTVVDASGGFLNRYRNIVETHDGNQHLLSCHKPGFQKCRWVLTPPTNPTGLVKFEEGDLANIETSVFKFASIENSGKLFFDNRFYITYTYNEDKDQLRYIIYTIDEAKELKLI